MSLTLILVIIRLVYIVEKHIIYTHGTWRGSRYKKSATQLIADTNK